MANEINIGSAPKNIAADTYSQTLKLSGADSTKTNEVVGKAAEVLAGANIKITRGDDASTNGIAERKTFGATNVPVLDNPDDAKAKDVDLTKLMSYLQLDNQERQTELAKDRIDMQKAGLDTEHKDRMNKIDESIKKMEKAERAAKISRIFGWIGAVLAVVAAAVLTVVTGGLAAGFAIAGAALAVTSLIMSETGATDAIVNALAEHLQEKYGMSRNDAMLAASLIVNLSIMVLQVGCSVGGMVAGFSAAGSAAANAASTAAKLAGDTAKTAGTASHAAKTIQNIVTIANTLVSAGSLASNGVSTYLVNRSENAKADTTELEKFLTMLQQRLDESQEELQKILEQIQSGIGIIAQLLSSSTDTSNAIAMNLGQMA